VASWHAYATLLISLQAEGRSLTSCRLAAACDHPPKDAFTMRLT